MASISSQDSRRRVDLRVAIVGAVIGLATVAVYLNALAGPFVFDDQGAIVDNATIRALWPPKDVLSPPIHGLPVTGRPLTNLSFAANYALNGLDVQGYHLVNVALHVICSLLIFGLLRRTLARPGLAARYGRQAVPLAAAVALLWAVHPLQTAAVTYIAQRAESLGSACLLFSLYTFVRAIEHPRRRAWLTLSALGCWCGIGAKEISAAIPLLVVAYDRLLVAARWKELWRQRGGYYAALFASWAPLAWLIHRTQNRGATWAGDSGFTPWAYARVQAEALVHYLQLVAWPTPLVFDYGRNLPVPSLTAVLPQGLTIVGLLTLTGFALWRRHAIGWLGLCFFAILAPTSSFVPIADALFEHRMYLPSACVLTALVLFAYRVAGARALWVVPLLAVLLGAATLARNQDYRSAVALWSDTVRKRPDNARAQGNLGEALVAAGRVAEALPHFEAAHRLTPELPLPAHNLANALDLLGRRAEAIAYYREALRLQPKNFLSRANLANALAETGEIDEALRQYEQTLQDAPELFAAHRGYGRALLRTGRLEDAITSFRRGVELRPRDADAQFNLGDALGRAHQLPEAIEVLRTAVALRPDHVAAWNNLGTALLLTRQVPDAITALETALRLQPAAPTHTNLGLAYLLSHRREDAVAQFDAALALDPDYQPARSARDRLRR